jgi:transposase
MPDAFFDIAVHHWPPEPPVGPEGGRPPVSHRIVRNVLWFVLVSGCRWEDVPPQLGCSGMTAHRYLRRWEEMGVWDRWHVDLRRLLLARLPDSRTSRQD